MFRYSAEYWKDRADEIRAIRDTMTSEEPRRIMLQIAADYLRLHDCALEREGPLSQRQAIEDRMSSPFSAAAPKE
jgi:hypothetical protein